MSFSSARAETNRIKRQRMRRSRKSETLALPKVDFFNNSNKYLTIHDMTDNQKGRIRDALGEVIKNGVSNLRQIFNALVGHLSDMIQGKRLEANHLVLGIRNGKHTKHYALTLEDFHLLCA